MHDRSYAGRVIRLVQATDGTLSSLLKGRDHLLGQEPQGPEHEVLGDLAAEVEVQEEGIRGHALLERR